MRLPGWWRRTRQRFATCGDASTPPAGALWAQAVEHWSALRSDRDVGFDRELEIDCAAVRPTVTWGTHPEQAIPIGGRVPDPASFEDPHRVRAAVRALEYMELAPGTPTDAVRIDAAFIGSCTNSRLSDLAGLLRSVTTFDVTTLPVGKAHYSLYCTEDGGIEDDIFLYHLPGDRWLVIHNAANADQDFERLRAVAGDAASEVTPETVMLAVQGPEAVALLSSVLGGGFAGLEQRDCAELDWNGASVLVARTGYTGEDGGECIVGADHAGALWDAFIEGGATPAGLGARDTLRLEAALPLHGNDIDTSPRIPYEAGFGIRGDASTTVRRSRAGRRSPRRRPGHARGGSAHLAGAATAACRERAHYAVCTPRRNGESGGAT